ncbi:MAG: hypothetical protein L0271_12860 [Gemmatimonadetes bacterium]|nr:hypothetical protein [Gemmatimonadota bacterium]
MHAGQIMYDRVAGSVTLRAARVCAWPGCPAYRGPGGFGAMVRAVLGAPHLAPQLTITLQGMAIRSLERGVTGGFTPVLRQIDELLAMMQEETEDP